jgi:hypothetical protein
VIQDVEDLIGWQTRLNYNENEMRPAGVNFTPFIDTTTEQGISFANLPKEGLPGMHRLLTTASAELNPAANTWAAGSAYLALQTTEISPDTPAKSPPDDASYSAPSGGVLATLEFEVVGDQSGRTLFMQIDDDNPNPPSSGISVFNGSQSEQVNLPESDLKSGFHAEGGTNCDAVPMPTNAPRTQTPTPPPVPPSLFADIEVTAMNAEAPQSAMAGERFDIRYTGNVVNRGPDGVAIQLLASYAWDSVFDCFSAPGVKNYWDLGYLGPSAVASFDITNGFTCYGTADSSTSGTMYLRVEACPSTSCAFDPDRGNNAWDRQSPFSVTGSAPVPTDPVDGGPTPSPVAGVVDTSSTGADAPQGNAQVSAPELTPAALAAAFPKTGESGRDGIPGWGYLLIASGVAVSVAGLAIARERIRPRRR